jgi:phosphate transport system substrate-binding protein
MKTIRNIFPAVLLLAAGIAQLAAQNTTPLAIEGSNTFGKDLGRALVTAFQKKNPDLAISLGTPGSGAGIDALIDGRCQIAPASRAANEDEIRRARAAGVKLRAHSIGSYGVAVIVNSKNPVRSLNTAQVRGIFTGDITNWKDVGGPDAAIQLIVHDDTTGSALGFRELALRVRPYAKSAKALPTDESIIAAVSANPHAIGYSGIGLATNGVHAILINGIPANRSAVLEGLYPYARTLYLYTNRASESRDVKDFIRFVQSREGQQILVAAGFVPRIGISLERESIAP